MYTPRFFILLIVCFWKPIGIFSQLTEAVLHEAVLQQQCNLVASQLDTLTLRNENMKFDAAVCLYRNGQADRALNLFTSIYELHYANWQRAAFWQAKIYATKHQDSLAVAKLLELPKGFLTEKLLAQTEFNNLVEQPSFLQLKKSLQPHFNLWTTILACITVIGYLVGFVFLFGRSRFSGGEHWLSLLVFAMAFTLTSYITIWTGYAYQFPYVRNLWPFTSLLIGPAIYFYLKTIFKEDYGKNEVLSHFIIPAIDLLFLLPSILRDFGVQMHLPIDVAPIASASALLTCQIVYYTVLVQRITKNEWQVDSNIKIWTRILFLGMKGYTFFFLSYFILVTTSFFNPQWDYAISMMMALGILVIAYMGLLQKRVFSSEPIESILVARKYQTSSLTPGATEAIKKRLERLLVEQQVFKENELRLDDLASYLDISRHQLSQVINEHYHVNFFELINRYRVDYVKKVLLDPAYDHYTIIQIAFDAGFNNKASFNTYFKREIGLTPSAYRMKRVT